MKISENGLLDLYLVKKAKDETGTFKWFEAEHAAFYKNHMAELERAALRERGGRPIIIGTGGDISGDSRQIFENAVANTGIRFTNFWPETANPNVEQTQNNPGLRAEALQVELERSWFTAENPTAENLVTPEEFQVATREINMEVLQESGVASNRRSRRRGRISEPIERSAPVERTFAEELAELDRISSLPEIQEEDESNN